MTPTGTSPKTPFRGVEILALRHPSKQFDTNGASALERGTHGSYQGVEICTRLITFYGKTGINVGMTMLAVHVEKARTHLSGTTQGIELVISKLLEVRQKLDAQLEPGPDREPAEECNATDLKGDTVNKADHGAAVELQFVMLFLVLIALKASELSLKDELKLYQDGLDELQEALLSLETHEKRAADVFERVRNCQDPDSGNWSWGLRRRTIIINLLIFVWVVFALLAAMLALVYFTQYDPDMTLAVMRPQAVAGWCTRNHEGWYLYRAPDIDDGFVQNIYRQVLERLSLA